MRTRHSVKIRITFLERTVYHYNKNISFVCFTKKCEIRWIVDTKISVPRYNFISRDCLFCLLWILIYRCSPRETNTIYYYSPKQEKRHACFRNEDWDIFRPIEEKAKYTCITFNHINQPQHLLRVSILITYIYLLPINYYFSKIDFSLISLLSS